MISYNFDGKWNGYCDLLRHYNLRSILNWVNYESRVLSQKDINLEQPIREVDVWFTDAKTRRSIKQKTYLLPWLLTDLAYHAIMATNDYRGKDVSNENEFLCLYAAERAYQEKNEEMLIPQISGKPDFFFYLWGFCGEQFRYEAPGKVLQNAIRELYILLDIAPRIGIGYIEDTVLSETGLPWYKLTAILFLLWIGSERKSSVNEIAEDIVWSDELTKSDFDKVISLYTCSYSEVKNSSLGRQLLYTKPYVRSGKDIICLNSFLSLSLYGNCVFWIVRNHYSDSQIFTNDFGKLFEEYFGELLETCVEAEYYRRIPVVAGKKRADWELQLCGYKILVEQKCPLLKLTSKQQSSDIAATKQFCERTILKAIKQLHDTEVDLNDGPYLKIVLLYEDYLQDSVLQQVFGLESCQINNDGFYSMLNISELELLLSLYKKNHEKIKTLLDRMCHEKKTLTWLLRENESAADDYLKSSRFDKYRNGSIEFLRSCMQR